MTDFTLYLTAYREAFEANQDKSSSEAHQAGVRAVVSLVEGQRASAVSGQVTRRPEQAS